MVLGIPHFKNPPYVYVGFSIAMLPSNVGWTKYFSRGVQPAGTSCCCIPKEKPLTTWHQDENFLACSDTLPMKYLAFAIALRLFARSFNLNFGITYQLIWPSLANHCSLHPSFVPWADWFRDCRRPQQELKRTMIR